KLRTEAAQKGQEATAARRRAADRAAEAALLRPGAVAGEAAARGALAHLLVHLDQDAAWQKRVILVIGLRQYIRTVGTQAIRFREMASQVDRLIYQDQKAYDADLAQ